MWRSGKEIVVVQHSQDLDLTEQQNLFNAIICSMEVESYDEAQRVWYSSKTRPKTIEVMQTKAKRRAKGF